MKQTVGFCQFTDAFRDCDRYDQFGYDALKALFEYLEELEEDCAEEIDLDVIGLCCDYTQYDSAIEAIKELISDNDYDEEDITEKDSLEILLKNTTVIEYNGGIIVQAF